MNEGWQNDDYFIIFTEDESLAAMKAYGIDHHLPGYTLLGLRGWDDFIVINSSGVMFTIPTLPLDASYAAPFALPQQISLEPDERFAGKIKWYTKPLVFGATRRTKQISHGSLTSNMLNLSSGGTNSTGAPKHRASAICP